MPPRRYAARAPARRAPAYAARRSYAPRRSYARSAYAPATTRYARRSYAPRRPRTMYQAPRGGADLSVQSAASPSSTSTTARYRDLISKNISSGQYLTGDLPAMNVFLNDKSYVRTSTTGSSITVVHREFIGSVHTATDVTGHFTETTYPINPGMRSTFQWLSQIAAGYEQYRINGMVFEFRSMSGDALNSTNTALGSVIMAVEYDSADPHFGTKADMESCEGCVSVKPSKNAYCVVDCGRNQVLRELYVRNAANPAGTDIHLYDYGRFSLATQGGQAAGVELGELWVTYSVTFFKPQSRPLSDRELGCMFYTPAYADISAANPFAYNTVTNANTIVPVDPTRSNPFGIYFYQNRMIIPATADISPGQTVKFTYYLFWSSSSGCNPVQFQLNTGGNGLGPCANNTVIHLTSSGQANNTFRFSQPVAVSTSSTGLNVGMWVEYYYQWLGNGYDGIITGTGSGLVPPNSVVANDISFELVPMSAYQPSSNL